MYYAYLDIIIINLKNWYLDIQKKIFEKIQKWYWHLKKSVIYYRHSKGTEVLKMFKVYVWSFDKSFNDPNDAYEYAERLNKQGYEAEIKEV